MWLYSIEFTEVNFNMSILEAESYHLGHLLVPLLTVGSQVNTYLPYHSQQDLKNHNNNNIIYLINIHKNRLIEKYFMYNYFLHSRAIQFITIIYKLFIKTTVILKQRNYLVVEGSQQLWVLQILQRSCQSVVAKLAQLLLV